MNECMYVCIENVNNPHKSQEQNAYLPAKPIYMLNLNNILNILDFIVSYIQLEQNKKDYKC